MSDEAQKQTLAALEMAIDMEDDGGSCYLQASEASKNDAGRNLFQSLAEEEEYHKQRFKEIYKEIRDRNEWPSIEPEPGAIDQIRQDLRRTCELMSIQKEGVEGEMDAVKLAIDKEKMSYDFYEKHAKEANFDTEKDFYGKLAAEERVHELALLDYYDYLLDPGSWFVKKEHHSLDGG